jgi:hypothetical protein
MMTMVYGGEGQERPSCHCHESDVRGILFPKKNKQLILDDSDCYLLSETKIKTNL